ncbi:MAG: flippase-like domain-containing protein, partial [Alphaproteobacteria bacterium]|nr:flippase-like domain-containing protein [Alphaproteobacteria bacterium]
MDNSSQTISAPIALGPGAALSAEAGKPAVKPLWQRLLGAGAKLAISAALIWLVCRNIDLRGLGERFVGQSPAWLVAAAVATLAQIPLAALRWSQILRALDLAIPGRTIFSISWIGSFFNSWLLGNGSGDVARALVAPPDTRGRAALVHSVLFDRAISFGGVALAILPVVALGLGPLSRGTPTLVSLAIVAAPFLAMFWVEPLAPLMVRWRLPFAGPLDGLVQSWQRLRRARGRVLLALTAAVMSEVALTFTAYALARAQHLEVS